MVNYFLFPTIVGNDDHVPLGEFCLLFKSHTGFGFNLSRISFNELKKKKKGSIFVKL